MSQLHNRGQQRKPAVHTTVFSGEFSAEPNMALVSLQALDIVGTPDMGRGRSEDLPLPISEVLVSQQICSRLLA